MSSTVFTVPPRRSIVNTDATQRLGAGATHGGLRWDLTYERAPGEGTRPCRHHRVLALPPWTTVQNRLWMNTERWKREEDQFFWDLNTG